MDSNVFLVLTVSAIGSAFSLFGCLAFFGRQKLSVKLLQFATPFAAGSLLATVFLDLYKDGLETSNPNQLFVGSLTGIILFFLAERFLSWFHHSHGKEDDKLAKNVSLILLGNGLHNALDGVTIATGFLISVQTGLVTTLAVTLHEIPHNVSDFGLLLKRGLSKKSTIIYTILANFSTVLVAILVYGLGSTNENLPISLFLGLSAGFLLYIALSDIMPEIHHHASKRKVIDIQTVMLLLGVASVAVAINLVHHFVS